MSVFMIIGALLTAWALLRQLGNEVQYRMHCVRSRMEAEARAAIAAAAAAEAAAHRRPL